METGIKHFNRKIKHFFLWVKRLVIIIVGSYIIFIFKIVLSTVYQLQNRINILKNYSRINYEYGSKVCGFYIIILIV